ncbi:hypothetical protein FHETE_8809 [Fusarium heterosporum]|uniref:Uncharacterized protein n=1 Tax=Fusarium heterosporum TaxID=42747 RepID=A0A8H5T1P7_FUSHE|nr:hypothetical protein FHETE_8809 [Fusarium heterosporum]
MLKTLFERPHDIEEEDVVSILSLATKTFFKDDPVSTLDWFNKSTVSMFIRAIQHGALRGLDLAPRMRHVLLISACRLLVVLPEDDNNDDEALEFVRTEYHMTRWFDYHHDHDGMQPSTSADCNSSYSPVDSETIQSIETLIQDFTVTLDQVKFRDGVGFHSEASFTEMINAWKSIISGLKRTEANFLHGSNNPNGGNGNEAQEEDKAEDVESLYEEEEDEDLYTSD